YADELLRAYALLNEAAQAVASEDEDLARYLRNRARDLLSDDYESGDAAWVTGRFKNLNVQAGAYEVYDDELYGNKAFFGFSVMVERKTETAALRAALQGLQALEDSLPDAPHRRGRGRLPLGRHRAIPAFGQGGVRRHP